MIPLPSPPSACTYLAKSREKLKAPTMNRQTLAEATSLHDGPVPIYLMEEIGRFTKESVRDAEKVADFLLGRLNKSNLIVKLKALQLIAYCIREGSPAFAAAVREDEQDIAAYLQLTGPPDPVYGDERYRRIRVASQEALVCLNDGSLSRHTEPAHAPIGNSWQAQSPQNPSMPAPYSDQPSYGGTNSYEQQGRYGHNGQSPARQPSQPWGNPSNSNPNASSGSSSFRPAPYQDTPSSSYGGNQPGGYNAQYGGNSSNYNGGGRYDQNSNNGGGYGANDGNSSGGYGYNNNSGAQGGYGQAAAPQANGLDSWSSAPAGGIPVKTTGSGMWSSAGYQKKDPAVGNELPRYNASRLSRDNRPTVLVGQSLNFPKPSGGFGSSSGYNGGVYGGNSGAYGGNTGAFGGNSGGVYGGNSGGYGGSSGFSGGGGFSNSRPSGVPGFMDNSNRTFSSNRPGMGMTNTQPLNVSEAPTTKLGKTVEGLKKISNEARERWDRRNMDKSMASSLADHDELRAGPQVIDRGYQYQPNHGTGGGDTSRDYERGMIDNLCASVGLARAPPADALKRFVDLAQTLDIQTIGDILLDKLEDPSWQVRLKGLHVVVALLESPNGAPYMDWFEENVEVVEELRKDPKPSVVSKALQVLRILGFADESEPSPTVQKRATRSERSSTTSSTGLASAAHAPAPAHHAQEEVDLLGFGSLSIEQQPPPTPVQAQPPAAPPQEFSLLDDFDPLNSSSSSNYAAQQQQYQQQQQQYAQQQQQMYHQQQQQQYAQQQQQMYHQQQQQQQQLPPQQAPDLLPLDDEPRAQTLSHLGKDLFTIANSPRNSTSSDSGPAAEKSAFGFM
ncbi:Epsin-like, n-terminal, partial [Globisporangium splendens]